MYKLLILLSVLISFALRAGTPSVYDYDVKHWTSADGLSSNSVRAVTRDNLGYVWFGTLYGLNRFDGQDFDVFTTDAYPKLASNTVTRLLTDTRGMIWLGTKAGLSVLDPNTLRFERLPIFSEVTAILEVAPGEIWVAADQLFSIIDGKVNRVDHIKSVVSQITQAESDIWVASSDSLYQRSSDGNWQQFALPLELVQNPIYALAVTASGTYIGGESGLYRLLPNGQITLQLLPDQSSSAVYQILEDAAGALWLSTHRKLYYQYPKQPWQIVTAAELGHVPWFSVLYQDNKQTIWLGSFSDGVYLASPSSLRRIVPGTEPVIRSVGLSPQGQLVFASQRAVGVLEQDGYYRQLISEDVLQEQTVHDLHWPEPNQLWLGTERGLFGYISSTQQFTPLLSELQGQAVRVVAPAHTGGVWIGASKGLYYLSAAAELTLAESLSRQAPVQPQNLLYYPPFNNELESRQITTLAENQRLLLLGTSRGVYRVQSGQLTRVGLGTALYNAYILATIVLPDDTVLVSTLDDGIFVQVPGQAWVQLSSGNGLLHGPALSFYFHQQSGWLWISTHKGVVRLKRDSLFNAATAGFRLEEVLSPYDRQMGSFSSRCCNGAGQAKVVSWQKQLWYPTLRGLIAVPEWHADVTPSALAPMLKEVAAFERYPLSATQARQVLQQQERNITISYSAQEFKRPDSVIFRYQLVGFDDHWHEVANRREAVYTNLPPGSFTFLLQAKYQYQTWNDAHQTQIELVIPQRFDETLLYRLLWLCLLLGGFYIAFWLYRKNSLLKQQQLARLVKERTLALENTNRKLNELNEQLSQLTHRDAITGLRNIRFMQEQLPKDIEHFQRNRQSLMQQGKTIALLILEITEYHTIFAAYGNSSADAMLQHVSALLSRETRGSDYVVRCDNARFIVVFRDIASGQVAQYSRRLVEQLSHTTYVVTPDHVVTLNGCGGFALYPIPLVGGQLLNWEVSLQLAEYALHQLQTQYSHNKVATIAFSEQLDAFEFEENNDLVVQTERLMAEGLLTLVTH